MLPTEPTDEAFGLGERTSSTVSVSVHKISSLSLCCNMVLSMTGTAVLGVGSQMKTYGWILTPISLVLAVILSAEMVWVVSATSQKIEDETGLEIVAYQDFAEAALGRGGWWASSISSVLSLVCFIIGGIILEAQNLQIVAPIHWSSPLGGTSTEQGEQWWKLFLTATTLFYCFVDIGQLLHGSGFIGVGLTIFVMTSVYIGMFGQFGSVDSFNPACDNSDDGVPYHSLGLNNDGSQGFQSFLDVFSVSSYMVFTFAIVVTLPTLRSTMRRKEDLYKMSSIAFAIVAALFIIVMLAYYWVFGNLGPDNIIDGMRMGRDDDLPGWWATVNPWHAGKPTIVGQILSWGVTFHLLCSDAIYVPVAVVSIEKLLPSHWVGRKRVWITLRLFVSFMRWFIGSVVTDFVTFSNLTSAAFLTLNNNVLPILCFYHAGPKERAGTLKRTGHLIILVFSTLLIIFGTINAVQQLVAKSEDAGTFPRAHISVECQEAFCKLNSSNQKWRNAFYRSCKQPYDLTNETIFF